MANPVSGVSNLQQTAKVAEQNQTQRTKPAQKAPTAAPQDTINISAAGKAASQAQTIAKPNQTPGDVQHYGNNE